MLTTQYAMIVATSLSAAAKNAAITHSECALFSTKLENSVSAIALKSRTASVRGMSWFLYETISVMSSKIRHARPMEV